MARRSSSLAQIAGLALLVVGVGLALWGYQMSESLTSRVSEVLSGAPPDPVMVRYLAGAACAAAGLFLLARR